MGCFHDSRLGAHASDKTDTYNPQFVLARHAIARGAVMETKVLYEMLEQQYFGANMQERVEIDRLPQILQNVRLFVDVGASIGQYTFFANKALKNARIVSIEADPIRYRRLAEAAANWEKLSSNQIRVIHAAAADKPGEVEFYSTPENSSGGLFVPLRDNPEFDGSSQWVKTEVDCVSLDSLFKDCKPDFVKMDVEGAEYRVLLGAREILQEGNCRFFVEVHPWGDEVLKKTAADVFRLFAAFGYDFKRVHRHWLFEKSNHPVKRFIKIKLIVFIMNNQQLKQALKKAVLAFSGHANR
jgi:FkbM family methyltransferase